MFEKATRLKLRFDTPLGALSAEDLWDLPLTSRTGRANLDDIAVRLHHATKDTRVSFVEAASKTDEAQELRFEIVKHVIAVRQEENRIAADARAAAEKKQTILSIIARKEVAELENASIDELRALVNAA